MLSRNKAFFREDGRQRVSLIFGGFTNPTFPANTKRQYV